MSEDFKQRYERLRQQRLARLRCSDEDFQWLLEEVTRLRFLADQKVRDWYKADEENRELRAGLDAVTTIDQSYVARDALQQQWAKGRLDGLDTAKRVAQAALNRAS